MTATEDAGRAHFLLLCARDFWDVGIVVDFLLGQRQLDPQELDGRVLHVLEVGMLVTYARPFTTSHWQTHLEPSTALDDVQRSFHDQIIERRHKVYAHTDESNYRTITNFQSAAGIEASLADPEAIQHEEFDSLAEEALRTLWQLAKKHSSEVFAELATLRPDSPSPPASP